MFQTALMMAHSARVNSMTTLDIKQARIVERGRVCTTFVEPSTIIFTNVNALSSRSGPARSVLRSLYRNEVNEGDNPDHETTFLVYTNSCRELVLEAAPNKRPQNQPFSSPWAASTAQKWLCCRSEFGSRKKWRKQWRKQWRACRWKDAIWRAVPKMGTAIFW